MNMYIVPVKYISLNHRISVYFFNNLMAVFKCNKAAAVGSDERFISKHLEASKLKIIHKSLKDVK